VLVQIPEAVVLAFGRDAQQAHRSTAYIAIMATEGGL